MVCRDEHITETNSVGLATLIQDLRLERIAAMWEYRCAVKHAAWVDEYNRRKEANQKFMERYTAWTAECKDLEEQLRVLLRKFRTENPRTVTPTDWDAVTAGKERKVFRICGRLFPKETWPLQVPYLNLIARVLYKEEEERRQQHMKQYWKVVKDIKRRGEECRELKRIAGDHSDGIGFEKPLTEEQVQYYRKKLRVEKQDLEAEKAQLFKELANRHGLSYPFQWTKKQHQQEVEVPCTPLLRQAISRSAAKARFLEFFERVRRRGGINTRQSRVHAKVLLDNATKHETGSARYILARAILDEAFARIGVQRNDCTACPKGTEDSICRDRELLELILDSSHRQPIRDKAWDAKVWAESVFTEAGVIASEQAKARVAQDFENTVKQYLQRVEPEDEVGTEQDTVHED